MSAKQMTLDEVLELLEKFPDDEENSNEIFSSCVSDVTVTNANNKITIFVSPPDNGFITDEDSGDESYVQLQNLPRSQILAEAAIPTLCIKDSTPTEKKNQKSESGLKKICLLRLKN